MDNKRIEEELCRLAKALGMDPEGIEFKVESDQESIDYTGTVVGHSRTRHQFCVPQSSVDDESLGENSILYMALHELMHYYLMMRGGYWCYGGEEALYPNPHPTLVSTSQHFSVDKRIAEDNPQMVIDWHEEKLTGLIEAYRDSPCPAETVFDEADEAMIVLEASVWLGEERVKEAKEMLLKYQTGVAAALLSLPPSRYGDAIFTAEGAKLLLSDWHNALKLPKSKLGRYLLEWDALG